MWTTLLEFLFAWQNLPFTALLGVCGLLGMVQLIGLENAEGYEPDAELEAEAELEQELEGEPELDYTSNGLSFFSLLAFIGFGQAPLMVTLLILFSAIGLTGWLVNGLTQLAFGTYPSAAIVLNGPLAVLGGGWIGARLNRLIGQALPPISTTASRAQELIGQTGTVISPMVDSRYGLVHLRNPGGVLISIFGVTLPNAPPLLRGTRVTLTAYDAQAKRYEVQEAGD